MLTKYSLKISKEEAIAYCEEHRDEYIRDSDSVDEGIRQYDCLIVILEDGTIKPNEIAAYRMNF